MFKPTPLPRQPGWYVIPGYSQYAADRKGHILNTKTGYYSKGGNAGRYLKVSVYRDGDEAATLQHVHDLVCRAFWGLPIPGQVVLHKNDQRWDNRPSNLEWGSQSRNIKDTYLRGIRQPTYGPRVRDTLSQEVYAFTQEDLEDLLTDTHTRTQVSRLSALVPSVEDHDTDDASIVVAVGSDGQQTLLSGGTVLRKAHVLEKDCVPVHFLHLHTLRPFALNEYHPEATRLVNQEGPPWAQW